MTTWWICTEHLRDPSVVCDPKHSTLTTTRRELADRLAYRPDDTAYLCAWCAAEKHEKCRGEDECRCGCNNRAA